MTDAAKKILENRIAELEKELEGYRESGVGKLYFSLQRKANEMADLLNSVNLKNVNIDDAKDKSFERIFKILEKSSAVSDSIRSLSESIPGTKKEEKKPFLDRIADIRDQLWQNQKERQTQEKLSSLRQKEAKHRSPETSTIKGL